MTSIKKIEGIGEEYGAKLREVGIATVEALLEASATPKQRQELVEQTGLSPKLILKWANRADLFRVRGIGEEYGDLLELAGVDTVPELAQRNPQNLYEALVVVNEEKNLVRRLPSAEQVAEWVEQAKSLPRKLHY